MGLIISIYKDSSSSYDCTNGGVSSRHTSLTLVNVDGPFEPTPERPACWLVKGNVPGSAKIVIAEPGTDQKWSMMGGNYGGTSDSRFNRAVERITGQLQCLGPVPIHDRYE